MMYWNGHGMNGWGIGLMTVSMLLLWALLIVGVVALGRYVVQASEHRPFPPSSGTPAPERPTPEQLLAVRLARGEIDPDEYGRRLDVLRDNPPGAD